MSNSRGFRRKRKVFKLTYEEFDGLEIMARGLPVGEMLDILKIAAGMGSQPSKEQVTELLSAFADQIQSWTYLDEDGNPLPPTVETLLAEDDFGFVMKLVNGWVEAIAGTPDPTAPPGTGTAAGLEASIPMTPPPGT